MSTDKRLRGMERGRRKDARDQGEALDMVVVERKGGRREREARQRSESVRAAVKGEGRRGDAAA